MKANSNYDIVIVGGGIVGMTTALALAKQTSLRIAVIEAHAHPKPWLAEKYDFRVSALSLASQKILANLNVWDKIPRVSAYQHMQVWDTRGVNELHFDSADLNCPALGYIVENSALLQSLYNSKKEYANIDLLASQQIIKIEKNNIGYLLATDNQQLTTKLIVGADGINSWLRTQANIALIKKDYLHTAIVATVTTENSHQVTAWQRFLPQEVLAFLPLLNSQQCSIVWSVPDEQAQYLLALSEVDFCQALNKTCSSHLGKILNVENRHSFPLYMQQAKHYIADQLLLIGDAAHHLHPLAGQGLNLSLLEVAYLADLLAGALNKNRDFSSFTTLRRYERQCKSDAWTMLLFINFIKQLFISKAASLQAINSLGLKIVNDWPWLKNYFAHYALGQRSHSPFLARDL